MHSELHTRSLNNLAAATLPFLQGFSNVQTASGSSCVASGASAESGGNTRNSSGGPTPAPTFAPRGTGCQVANCAACRGAPTNCYLCNSVSTRAGSPCCSSAER